MQKKIVIQSEQFLWADRTRVLASVFVVTLHTVVTPYHLLSAAASSGHLAISGQNIFSIFILLLGKTGVPLFLLLSGALLLGREEAALTFFSKRLKRIVLPWALWTLIFTGYKYQLELTSLLSFLQVFIRVLTAEFNFIPALFCLYCLVPYLRTLIKHTTLLSSTILLCVWFITICVLPFSQNSLAFPRSIDTGIVRQVISYFGYFFGGYIISQKVIHDFIHKRPLFFSLFTISAVSFSFRSFFIAPKDWSYFFEYHSPIVAVLAFTIFFLLCSSTLPEKKYRPRGKRAIALLSRLSFHVFFVHTLLGAPIRIAVTQYGVAQSFVADLSTTCIVVVLSYCIAYGTDWILGKIRDFF